MCSIIVGMLCDQELLDLDEKVSKYWPEFATKNKSFMKVTNVLCHEAGLK